MVIGWRCTTTAVRVMEWRQSSSYVNPPAPKTKGVWGRSPQPSTSFYDFHKKNTHFSIFFYRIRACSECSHYGQRINILQLMSQSRSLAKISGRRLQPLLVFNHLLQARRGGRKSYYKAERGHRAPLRALPLHITLIHILSPNFSITKFS